MLTDAHTVIYSSDAPGLRVFLRNAFGLDSVDAGGGWLILALAPTGLDAQTAQEGGRHQVYLACDDIISTVTDLESRGVQFTEAISDVGWGLLTAMRIPGNDSLALYEPRQLSPLS